MKKIIISLVLLGLLFWGVNLIKNNEPHNLTFGLISGTVGDYAFVGEGFNKGVYLAQEEWNKGKPNNRIEIIAENDEFDGKKGLSAYQKLINVDKVDGLINMTTFTIDVIYDLVVEKGIPVALGFEQSIDAKRDNVVQLWPGTIAGEVKLGEYTKEKGFKNIVLFVDNGSAGYTRFADGFKSGYGSSMVEMKISGDSTSIRSAALKAVSLKPDAMVFIINPKSGSQLVKEINSLNKNHPQYIFDSNIQAGFADYTKIVGNNGLDGSIVYTVPTVYREKFTQAYKLKHGIEPTIGSETGYNAFMLLASTYDSNNAKWVRNMQEFSFEGADGKIVFDENGIRIPELKIGTIENGKLPN